MMISMNITVIARVFLVACSKTSRVKRPLMTAATTAVRAPITEASVRLVQPLTKGIIIEAKMTMGSRAARNRRMRSAQVIAARSSADIAGANAGFHQQRTTI